MHTQIELLITTFAPFQNRKQSGSHSIGTAIQKKAAPRVEILHLPVHWGSIENLALPRNEQLKPRIVLGLGEGEPSAKKFETLAINQRLGVDEQNDPPPTAHIDPLGPEQLSARWPHPSESIFHPEQTGQISQNAGRLLCNNALYRFLQSQTPFAGFLHLPPQGMQSDADYRKSYLPLVQQIIDNALAASTKLPKT